MKKKALTLLAIALCGASVAAQANSSLKIINDTAQYSTAIINGGSCSDSLGSVGITNPHSKNEVSEFILGMACMTSPDKCTAEIYMTKDCQKSGGKAIATVTFSLKNGITPISVSKDSYELHGSGFEIKMSGGPSK